MKSSQNSRMGTKRKSKSFGTSDLWRLGIAIALAPFLFLAACTSAATERAAEVGGVTARQVIENPAAYVGKTVTVSGQVEENRGPRAFVMDSGLTVGELLVIGREAYPHVPDGGNRAYVVNDVATVTGVVRMLVAADVEREIGWDLDPQLEVTYNSKPVLIAQSIAFRAGPGPANTNMMANQSTANTNMNVSPAMTNTNTNMAAGNNWLTDVAVYASTADKLSLVGRDARFSNLRVTRVVGPRTFTVASGNGEMYVMLDDASARGIGTQGKIGVGSTLDLTGRFERLEKAEIDDLSNARFRPLTDTERKFLKNTAVFLQATGISGLA